MRSLNKNKITLWLVEPTGETEIKDKDGNYTGEFIKTYSTPKKIHMILYPANSEVVKQLFGTDASFDMVSVSNDVELTEFSLLYLSEPRTDFGNTYDYKVSKIAKSLNSYSYGLHRRV